MLKQACGLCKVVGAIAILGALNAGIAGVSGTNLAEQLLGAGAALTVFSVLVGLSGLGLLVSFFTICPKCKRA
jgi:uncharacterized membrane protein YuzA (DUF378 family)